MISETMIQIAASIRAARVVRKKTIAEIAALTGLSPSYLSELERGIKTPSIATLERIYAVYGMKIKIVFEYPFPNDCR